MVAPGSAWRPHSLQVHRKLSFKGTDVSWSAELKNWIGLGRQEPLAFQNKELLAFKDFMDALQTMQAAAQVLLGVQRVQQSEVGATPCLLEGHLEAGPSSLTFILDPFASGTNLHHYLAGSEACCRRQPIAFPDQAWDTEDILFHLLCNQVEVLWEHQPLDKGLARMLSAQNLSRSALVGHCLMRRQDLRIPGRGAVLKLVDPCQVQA